MSSTSEKNACGSSDFKNVFEVWDDGCGGGGVFDRAS